LRDDRQRERLLLHDATLATMADHFRVWLDRRTASVEMERRVAAALLEAGEQAPLHMNDPRRYPPATPGELRGIPVVGRNVEGAIRHTRPGFNLR
jgi:hypothetical protein